MTRKHRSTVRIGPELTKTVPDVKAAGDRFLEGRNETNGRDLENSIRSQQVPRVKESNEAPPQTDQKLWISAAAAPGIALERSFVGFLRFRSAEEFTAL